MRVTMVIYSLGSGGAERVLATMANYWATRGWQIQVLTLTGERDEPFYELHPSVIHRPLGVAQESPGLIAALYNNCQAVRALRSALKETRPDVVIGFMTTSNVLTLAAAEGLSVPVIVSEHSDPYEHSVNKFWDVLRRVAYARAASLVVLTERALSYFPVRLRRRGLVIPNPVFVSRVGAADSAEKRSHLIVGLGRLSFEKGFDQLLRAFALVAQEHPDWSLVIWGDGPSRGELEVLIKELDLQGRVQLPGKTREPEEKLRQADLFVCPSRYEGFGNAICEAMACGVPVISFDCPSGPRTVIRDGIDGILVTDGDIAALAAAISKLIKDRGARFRLSQRAPEVLERFGLGQVMPRWEQAIRKAGVNLA